MNYLNISTKLFAFAFFIFFISLPLTSNASYTFNGKTFTSFSEYKGYVRGYMEAWRENNTRTTTTKSRNKTTSYSSKYDIETKKAEDVTTESATFTGELDFKKTKIVRIWFDYGTSKYNLNRRTATEDIRASKYNDEFDRKAINLTHDTTYYYRAAGINENSIVQYGDIEKFTTEFDIKQSNALISVSTKGASDVDEDRATFNASINFKKENYAYVWFEYSDEEDDLFKKTTKTLVRETDGKNITKTIKKLRDEKEYYYRAMAQDRFGELSYGKTVRFKTKRDIENEHPDVDTDRATDITLYSAVLQGSIDMNDFKNGTAFLIYGESKEDIDEVRNEISRYSRIREYGDDLKKILLDEDLDSYDEYTRKVRYLDLDTKHYYAFGVEFEDENDDDKIILGSISSFTTKED